MKTLVRCVLAALLLAGCGKKTPTAPAVTTTGISISSNADFVKIGAQQQLTLTATLSDGTSKTVSGTWTTDAAGIATVTGGLVRGVASGDATIGADYDGQHATRKVRVTPDFNGSWTGTYKITTCTDTGAWVGTCDPADAPKNFIITMTFTQTNASVSGSVAAFSDLTIPASGSIAVDGLLALSGSKTQDFGGGLVAKGDLINWETRMPDATHMTGKFTVVTTSPGVAGDWTLNCDLLTMTKTVTQVSQFSNRDDSRFPTLRLADILRRPR